MKYFRNFGLVLILLTLLFLVFPRNAHAYLDPGSVSYMLQIIIAALLGSLFAIKMFWGRIKEFIKGVFSKKKNNSDDN
ncbi:hypothetical protein ACFLQ8_00020 [Candidatus Auribacterota bacterium]